MYTSLRVSALLALLLLFTLPLWAQTTADTTPADDEPDVVIIVTDNAGMPHPASESISSVTVVTAKEIERQGAQTVADVLRLVPGVSLRQSGQMGGSVSSSMRGTGSKQLLVLLDGQRVSSQSFIGGVDLSKYPVEQIARVEVLRGPASSLYGSEAFGGVVNLITKRATKGGGDSTLTYGSHGRSQRSFTLRGVEEPADWVISGTFPTFDGKRANSDYKADELSGRLTFGDVKGWELGLRADSYSDAQGLPGSLAWPSATDRQKFDRLNFDFTAKRDIADGSLTLRAYTLEQKLLYDSPPYYSARTISKSNAAELSYGREWANHQLIVGGEYRDDSNTNEATGSTTATNAIWNRALFVQDRYAATAHTSLVVGARFDDHATAGSKLTPRAGVNYAVSARSNARASFAAGFRAPNFVELYSYYPDATYGYGTIGNPNLKPENSQQFELGYATQRGGFAFDIAVFQTLVRDLITYSAYTGPAMPDIAYSYYNINRARMRGVELTAGHRVLNTVDLGLSYSYIDARDRATDARLIGVPHSKIALTASRAIAAWQVALAGNWVDDTPDFAGTVARNHVVFDLTVARRGNGNVQPFAVIRNLLNSSYEEVAGYPAEGRSLEIGLRSGW